MLTLCLMTLAPSTTASTLALAPPAIRMIPTWIPVVSMMRSGSSELCADLALNSNARAPLRYLGEPFNFGGADHPRKKDPLGELRDRRRRENVTQPSIVFKLFSGHLDGAALAKVLRSAAACVVVLERRNATARACSLAHSLATTDWSGHEHTHGHEHGAAAPGSAGGAAVAGGARWHPPCAPIGAAAVSSAERSQRRTRERAQREWFSLVRRTLGVSPSSGLGSLFATRRRVPHLWLTLENISHRTAAGNRRGVLNEVYRFCGLPQLEGDAVVRKAKAYRRR